jgi:uncharacterized membrane protein
MHHHLAELANILGLIGVVLVLSTYLLLQMRKITSHHFSYSALNLVSSLFIIFSLCYQWNLPSFIIEIVWALISAYGIYLYYTKRAIEP